MGPRQLSSNFFLLGLFRGLAMGDEQVQQPQQWRQTFDPRRSLALAGFSVGVVLTEGLGLMALRGSTEQLETLFAGGGRGAAHCFELLYPRTSCVPSRLE